MADAIARLIHALGRLPGIGEKTATRLAFHLLRAPDDEVRELSAALLDVKDKVRLCSLCRNLTEEDPCAICRDPRRDGSLVCVVARPPEVLAVERSGYRGRYHVLHGVLAPLDGIGPDDLQIAGLLERVSRGEIGEVILATNPNVEGEATALYLARLLRPQGVRLSRIASGLPVGGELEYADHVTLARAIETRRELP